MPTVPPGELRRYVARIFEAAGAPADDAAEVTDHLVDANLKGHDSHGVFQVALYVLGVQEGKVRPAAPIEVERETETTAVANGNWNFGQVVARDAMAIAVAKARTQGLAAVGGCRSAHIGRVGAYGEQAASEGMVALGWLRGAWATVVPFAGAAVAHDFFGGDPPGSRAEGALLPIGAAPDYGAGGDGGVGHKGYALALVIDLLGGALTGAGTGHGEPAQGFLFIAIDPERFVGLGPFEDELASLLDYVKQPPYAEGFDEILTPGEPERRRMAERRDGIPLDDATWRQVAEAAASVGVGPYDGEVREG